MLGALHKQRVSDTPSILHLPYLPVLSCQQSLLFMEETESDWALSADPRNTGSGRGGCLAVDQLYGRFRLKQKGAFLWLEICLDVAAVYVLIKY